MAKQLKIMALLGLCSLLATGVWAEESSETRARRLINALGCKGCHTLEGDGGTLAPPLDQVGRRLSREQIAAHMAAHASSRQTGFMPSYGTTPQDDLLAIGDFLFNLQ